MGTYLGAVDLVTQNQLTIIARIGINPSDRQLGDVSPGLATIFVSNGSTSSRSVGYSVATEFNVTKSVVDNMGGKKFSTQPLSVPVYSTPQNNGYATFNQQVGVNFGSMALTATDFSTQLFATPGTYTWTVPAGVTAITVGAVGGGGGGSQKTTGGSGGGGGLTSYSNSIAVTPGTTCTIIVGSGGATGGTYGLNGNSTYLLLPGTNVPIVIAQGGAGGDSIYWLSGSIGIASYTDVTGIITTQAAYDPAGGSITYSISSGSLPTGASLNVTTGALSWVSQNLANDTEYTPFTLAATNGSQTITKQFTLKILKVRTVSYLIVAGGGGGGSSFGGGGGAGGLLTGSVVVNPGTTYNITVGAGATQTAAAASTPGTNGNTSTAFSINATGGGGGGAYLTAGGQNTSGGSGGGGGSSETSTTYNGAAGIAGQGNNGGAGLGAQGYVAGGGGGAGAVGSPAVANTRGGNGGIGSTSTLITTTQAIAAGVGQVSGGYVYFAGGGGGAAYTYSNGTIAGTGGLGGAGDGQGGNAVRGAAGTANTGGGGGGGGYSAGGGGAGGSGVIIVSYPDSNAAATTTGSPTYIVSGGYRTYIWTGTGTIVF